MKAKVDKGKCIGSGNCESTCPEIFKMVDGVSEVQKSPVPGDQKDCVTNAIDGCPASAISIS